ncbi:Hypothetical protein A7982_08838 [Minicystis rosea]|nr:Hypothetical protein A7982_08838 [Minicystis rosea]
MARSRSSFDLAGAIATAASLSTTQGPEEAPSAAYRSMALVSFGPTATGEPSVPPPAPSAEAPDTNIAAQPRPPESEAAFPASSRAPSLEESHTTEARRPPRLPDLSNVQSPTQRCERIVEWIVEAVGAQDVFIADAAGLPIAGALVDAEARVAASGVVATAVAHLAAAVPGNTSTLFELHVGEGPFFQVIGFEIAAALYLVGLTRATPLTYRQAHAVRLACRHALADLDAPRTGGSA